MNLSPCMTCLGLYSSSDLWWLIWCVWYWQGMAMREWHAWFICIYYSWPDLYVWKLYTITTYIPDQDVTRHMIVSNDRLCPQVHRFQSVKKMLVSQLKEIAKRYLVNVPVLKTSSPTSSWPSRVRLAQHGFHTNHGAIKMYPLQETIQIAWKLAWNTTTLVHLSRINQVHKLGVILPACLIENVCVGLNVLRQTIRVFAITTKQLFPLPRGYTQHQTFSQSQSTTVDRKKNNLCWCTLDVGTEAEKDLC